MQRILTRHPANNGSVLSFDMFGKAINLFIADAEYRDIKEWGRSQIQVTDLNYLTYDNKYINPLDKLDITTEPLPYEIPDTELQERFKSFSIDKSARENTDVLLNYNEAKAAQYCRSLALSEVGVLDLPTIYQLIVIYLEADRIDALDPSVNSYSQYALGTANPNGRFNISEVNFAWSSTGYDILYARSVTSNGRVSFENERNIGGVIPVKEL